MSVLWDILLMAIERAFRSAKDSSGGKTGEQDDDHNVEGDSSTGLEDGTDKTIQDQLGKTTESKSP